MDSAGGLNEREEIMVYKSLLLAWGFLGIASLLVRCSEAAENSFFKGKVIRIVVATSAGGGFDAYSRMIARHMGKHIPGTPSFVVENMPGAGHLLATKYMYHQAKPDGLTMGNFHGGGKILQQILEGPEVEYDMKKFEWVGLPVSDTQVCVLAKRSGVGSLESWLTAKQPLKIGSSGPFSGSYEIPHVLKEALNLPLQVVSGYKGTAEIRLAADSGEIDGGCWNWESVKVTWRNGIETGDAKVIVQAMPSKHRELPAVPLAGEHVKGKEGLQLIKAGIQDPAVIVRVYSLPPGTPKERVRLLQKAFMATMADPEFLEEANKSSLDLDPKPGDDISKLVNAYFKLDPALMTKLREILVPKK
jgi:tripartite-type tricarboxylate transporter receptor subunit TctC